MNEHLGNVPSDLNPAGWESDKAISALFDDHVGVRSGLPFPVLKASS